MKQGISPVVAVVVILVVLIVAVAIGYFATRRGKSEGGPPADALSEQEMMQKSFQEAEQMQGGGRGAQGGSTP